jgi:uncharacterized protein
VRLKEFVDGLFPGRWDVLRPATSQELRATSVLSLPIGEASAKVRTGPPKDDEDGYALDIWAGVLPVRLESQTPIDGPRMKAGVSVPEHVRRFRIG